MKGVSDMETTTHTFNRQAMFTPDGRITSIPSKLTENPNIEKQASLINYWEEIVKADAWLRSCK